MNLKIIQTSLPEVLLLEPKVVVDERGFFMESFNRKCFESAIGYPVDFLQDNHSRSSRNVLRGMHYQLRYPQGKLVRVVSGETFDVAVDMRRSSPYFGRWAGVVLSAKNRQQLWIPPGFAHGFLVLSETADVLYKTTEYWHPESERSLSWSDAEVGIRWPIAGNPVLSDKDRNAASLREAEAFQ
jgi:dTDP-4-dehydrorhamnose 3,5-epimerase